MSPALHCNLVSVSKLVASGFDVQFLANGASRVSDVRVYAPVVGPIYTIEASSSVSAYIAQSGSTASIELWHRRMGHLNYPCIQKLAASRATGIIVDKGDSTKICVPCLQGKQHMNFNKGPCKQATQPLELIHSDLCGPYEP